MNDCRLVLVVPCYNEASRLRGEAFAAFARAHADVGFLFVDDGSTDDTAAVVDRIVLAAPERMRRLSLDRNQGKVEAVRRGIREALDASPELVGFWDADLATPLEAVDDFLAVATSMPQVEIIIGARVLLMGRDIRRKASRHYLGRAFATAASLALGIPVYDTQCGAKVFRATPAVAALFAEPFVSRWIFDVEILARYLAARGEACGRARIYELAVREWHEVAGSKLRPSDFVRALFELIAIWRRWRPGLRRGGATGRPESGKGD
jgi:dolichyl-phosphate beta-glucosyltransferase